MLIYYHILWMHLKVKWGNAMMSCRFLTWLHGLGLLPFPGLEQDMSQKNQTQVDWEDQQDYYILCGSVSRLVRRVGKQTRVMVHLVYDSRNICILKAPMLLQSWSTSTSPLLPPERLEMAKLIICFWLLTEELCLTPHRHCWHLCYWFILPFCESR